MCNKYFFTKYVLTASVVFIVFPRQTHQSYVPKFNWDRKYINNVNHLSRSRREQSDVETFDPASKYTAQSEVLVSLVPKKASNPENGFNFTAEEMEKFKIWPYGIIPYYIDDYSFDTALYERLNTLLRGANSVTGLRFMQLTDPPKDDQERWVLFINRRGVLKCQDYTTSSFTNRGVQRVLIGYDCLDEGGGGLAEMVLALAGVPPQHNAPDRDLHVNVVMDNIIPEKRYLFKILSDDEWLFHDIGYDFLSAGHYDFHKYTINGAATLIPKEAVAIPVGEGDGISYKDIRKIQMLYNYIKRKSPKSKASDCSRLYKPAFNFDDFTPEHQDDNVLPRKKPIKYLNAAGKEETKEGNKLEYTESRLMSTSKLLYRHKHRYATTMRQVVTRPGKILVAALKDKDTDEDNK